MCERVCEGGRGCVKVCERVCEGGRGCVKVGEGQLGEGG